MLFPPPFSDSLYISDFIFLRTDQLLLVVPDTPFKKRGGVYFLCCNPKLWNRLPLHDWLDPSLPVFKSDLKILFFTLLLLALKVQTLACLSVLFLITMHWFYTILFIYWCGGFKNNHARRSSAVVFPVCSSPNFSDDQAKNYSWSDYMKWL